MSELSSLLNHWRADPDIAPNIVAWEEIPPRPARYVPLPDQLHQTLVKALSKAGIAALYTHQLEAWDKIRSGFHCAIITGTASGKSLAYNLPILNHLLENTISRALYLFPTKALAQDQAHAIQDLMSVRNSQSPAIAASTYDGDTPSRQRPGIRERSRLLITNPDMLHTGILPHHTRWDEFFSNLDFVLVDEMHTYRGVFGSHVANVIRRLKRIALFYGCKPRFILTSATIGNPAELAENLIEAPVYLIDEDGSSRGQKHFLIYNPPIVNPELGLRASMLQECVRLVEDLLTYNVQSIVFTRARRTAEIILRYLRPDLLQTDRSNKGNQLSVKNAREEEQFPSSMPIRSYRSGYLPKERREIEAGLRQGDVRAVIATTALELGIDIGSLEAVVLAGYPGTIATTWQQAGRAGRNEGLSIAILVTSSSPLDQFLAHHPEYFFTLNPEQGLINPDNLLILMGHLQCASFELPFHKGEDFGSSQPEQVSEILDFLSEEKILHESGTRYFWMSDKYPAQDISLRSTSSDNVLLQSVSAETTETIGEVDMTSALWMVHPEAIYLHGGVTYFVEELDLDKKIARLSTIDTDFYTRPRRETKVQLIEKIADTKVNAGLKAYGDIEVSTKVIGYQKIRWFTHENVGYGELVLPPHELQTRSYWIAISENTVEELSTQGLWSSKAIYYGSNWKTQRERTRLRDNFRCQICGVLEKKQEHHVHHKTPFRMFSSFQEANRLDNLITLCPACHRRTEIAVHIRSGIAGLGYVLVHLAPLFLMCDIGDLGLHTDPQSSLSGGKPTVAIYDLIPDGIGFSERLYELHQDLVTYAYDLVMRCKCSDGCPSCVGPGGEHGSGGKTESLAILNKLTEI